MNDDTLNDNAYIRLLKPLIGAIVCLLFSDLASFARLCFFVGAGGNWEGPGKLLMLVNMNTSWASSLVFHQKIKYNRFERCGWNVTCFQLILVVSVHETQN